MRNKLVTILALGLLLPMVANAVPIKALFLASDGGVSGVQTDILGVDARFDLSNSASMSAYSGVTLASLQSYDSVLFWTNGSPQAGMGGILADYVDGGGHLVISTFSGQTLSGRINDPGYNPLTEGGNAYVARSLGSYNAASQLFSGVTSLVATTYNGDVTTIVDPTATLIASWNDGIPLAGVNAAGNVVGISLFPNVNTYNHATGDYQQLFRNALAYNQSAPVPEPSILALFGLGLAGLGFARRKKV